MIGIRQRAFEGAVKGCNAALIAWRAIEHRRTETDQFDCLAGRLPAAAPFRTAARMATRRIHQQAAQRIQAGNRGQRGHRVAIDQVARAGARCLGHQQLQRKGGKRSVRNRHH